MYLAVRCKVRCTVCHEVFQNDYVGKHTKSKHKDLHAPGRKAPVTIELDKFDTRQSKAVSPPLPQTSMTAPRYFCMFTILILNSQSSSW
jgi:hypothetical protein